MTSIATLEAYVDTDLQRFADWTLDCVRRNNGRMVQLADRTMTLGPHLIFRGKIKPGALEVRYVIADRADWLTPVLSLDGQSVSADRTQVRLTCHIPEATFVLQEIQRAFEKAWPGCELSYVTLAESTGESRTTAERNQSIVARYLAGDDVPAIAESNYLSDKRVWNILSEERNLQIKRTGSHNIPYRKHA